MRRLLCDRTFLDAVLVTGSADAALSAHPSGATSLLQDVHGLSPRRCSYASGLDFLGLMVFGSAAGWAWARWSEEGTLVNGPVTCVLGAAGLLATTTLELPLTAVVPSLVTMVSGVAGTTRPTTSLAPAGHTDAAGTASSPLGVARFASGGPAARLVGLGGSSAVPRGS